MGIKDFFDKVGDVGRDAVNDLGKGIKDAGDFVGDRAQDVGGFVVDRAQDVSGFFGEVWKERDKYTNHPVPLEDIFSYYHGRVKLIRIDRVNEHRNGPAFGDAVGFDTNPEGLTVLNLYHDQIARTGFILLPNWDNDYYFKHPYLTDTYISLNYDFRFSLTKALYQS